MAGKRSARGAYARGTREIRPEIIDELRAALGRKLDDMAGILIAGGVESGEAFTMVAKATTTEGLARLKGAAARAKSEVETVGRDFSSRRSAEPPVTVAPPQTVSAERWDEIRGRARIYLRAFMGEMVDCLEQSEICSRHEAVGAFIAGMDDIILDYTSIIADKDYKSPYRNDGAVTPVCDIDEKVIGAARAESACLATMETLREGAGYLADNFRGGLCLHAPWMAQQIVGAALRRLGLEFLRSGVVSGAAEEAKPGEKLH